MSRGFAHARGIGPHHATVKHDRMRDAGQCADGTPVRGIRMRERAYKFSAHFGVGRNPQKPKTQTAYDPQRGISRMRAKSACVRKTA
jgi:hypothetical protein